MKYYNFIFGLFIGFLIGLIIGILVVLVLSSNQAKEQIFKDCLENTLSYTNDKRITLCANNI